MDNHQLDTEVGEAAERAHDDEDAGVVRDLPMAATTDEVALNRARDCGAARLAWLA